MPEFVGTVLVFLAVGLGLLLVGLTLNRFLRPARPNPDKLEAYECGEEPVGSAWVQFDLRFYVVALLFVVFDVEVALLFPWAVVFGQTAQAGDTDPAAARLAWVLFIEFLAFFGLLLVGFAYIWSRGDLNWVRSTAGQNAPKPGAHGAYGYTDPAGTDQHG